MITIATMGKFWPQPGYGLKWPPRGGGNYPAYIDEKKKPVIIVDAVRERNEKVSITITGISEI